MNMICDMTGEMISKQILLLFLWICSYIYIYVSVYFEWTSSISCQFFYKCWQCWMQTTSIKFHLIILSIFNCDSVHNRRVCPKIVDRLIAYWEIVAVAISLVFVIYFVVLFCTRDLNVNLAFHDWHKITLVALNLLELSSAHGNEVKLWQFRNINALLNRMFRLSFIVSLFSLILSLYFLVTIAAVR